MAMTTRMTAAEYLEREWDDRWTELVDGELIVNEPRPIHMVLQGHLYAALLAWTRETPGRGMAILPIDVPIDEHSVFAPDICWYREERRPRDLEAIVDQPPDLVVEVRSPSTWRYDVGPKKAIYETIGLPELWLVDTVAKTALVFRRSRPDAPGFDVALELGSGDTLRSPLLEGFALGVDDLFNV